MFKYLVAPRTIFTRAVILRVLNAILIVLWPFVFQLIVDVATGVSKITWIQLIIGTVAFTFFLDAVMGADEYYSNYVQFKAVALVRQSLIERIARMRPAEFAQNGVGNCVGKLTKQADNVKDNFYAPVMGLMSDGPRLVFAIIGIDYINLTVALISLALCLPTIVLPYCTSKALEHASEERVQQIDRYTSSVTDLLSGFNTLKFALSEGAFRRQHAIINDEMLQLDRKNELINQVTDALSIALNDMAYLATWIAGGVMLSRGQMTMGQLVAFSNLASMVSWPMTQLTKRIPKIIGGRKAGRLLAAFIDSTPLETSVNSPAAAKLDLTKAVTEMCAVTYQAGGKQILQGVSLRLEPKRKYLLVGASGSGKSTLPRMLLGEIAPTTGQSLFGERPGVQLARTEIYGTVGLLAQKGYVFAGTVRDNMTLFTDGYGDAAITAALMRAGLAPWLASHSLDTFVRESGPELSGGERQRLALARLYLRDYAFYVFDELTTGLDPHIADALQKDLFAMEQGFLMITHTYNEAAFRAADEILVMDAGRISARGLLGTAAIQRALHELALI